VIDIIRTYGSQSKKRKLVMEFSNRRTKMAKCKCGCELWAYNQKATKFLACPNCKTWYELFEYTPPEIEFRGTTVKFDSVVCEGEEDADTE
jgi:hypothetical protein